MKKDEIIIPSKIPDTSDVIMQTLEGLAGILSSDHKRHTRSIGYILQSFRGGKFLNAFKHEWEQFRKEGRIPDGYIDSDQHQECMQDLLDYLDEPGPDQKRFDILKKILLHAATEEKSSRDSSLPQQYMKIVKSLTSGEAIVLFSTYRLSNGASAINSSRGLSEAHHWLSTVAQESGLKYPELVESHEKRLIDKHLLKERAPESKTRVRLGDKFRLTSLGFELCKFVEGA